MGTIPIKECKHKFLYRLKSRSLKAGVFDERYSGFIGVARSFGHPCLFVEYHAERGGPLSSAYPKEELEKLPKEISLDDTFGAVDHRTWKPIGQRISKDGKTEWYFKDTSIVSEKIFPMNVGNLDFLDWLIKKEEYYKV